MFSSSGNGQSNRAHISRRTFLRALGTFFAATGMNCSAAAHALADPSVRARRAQYFPGPDAYSPVPLTGCTLSGAAAQSFRTALGQAAAYLS